MEKTWKEMLYDYTQSEKYKTLISRVKKQYEENICYPSYENIFNAFKFTSFSDIKVVILGQDPYHGEGQAHGLSFSVKDGVALPPSLKNIFAELRDDLGYKIPTSGSLIKWAKEGVLLLNSILSVQKDKPLSHSNLGWQDFTDEVIKIIDQNKENVVFILWGNYAKSKSNLITSNNNYVISSTHPSPFSAYNGFFGSKPFSKTNNYLIRHNIKPINFDLGDTHD